MRGSAIGASVLVLALAPGCGRTRNGFAWEGATSAALGPIAGMVFDSRGRPVIWRAAGLAGPILLDDLNRDGVFDTEELLAPGFAPVQAVLPDGRVLYLLGGSPFGLYRVEKGKAEALLTLGAGAGPGDIVRSPSGAITLLHGGRWLDWNEAERSVAPLATGLDAPRVIVFEAGGDGFALDARSQLLHVIRGGNYADPAFFDSLPAVVKFSGEASAMEIYRHRAFPDPLRGALFTASSTAVSAYKLEQNGATWRVTPRQSIPLPEKARVTALRTGPDGSLYVASDLGLHRLVYRADVGERWSNWRSSPPREGPLGLVRQPQPLSPWGQAALAREQNYLESRWGEELERLAMDGSQQMADREQALELLRRFGPKPKPAVIQALPNGLDHSRPAVRRRAAEESASYDPRLYTLLSDPDRFVRAAARAALERVSPRGDEWRSRAMEEKNPRVALEALLALVHTGGGEEAAGKLLEIVESSHAETRADAVRVFSLALPQLKDRALLGRAEAVLLALFPDPALNVPLATALAEIGGAEVIAKLLDAAEAAPAGALRDHYVRSLHAIRRGWTPAQRQAMKRWPGTSSAEAAEELRQRIFEAQTAGAGEAAAPPPGDGKGAATFARLCAACHNINAVGNSFGPDLTAQRDRAAVLEAVLWPSRQIAEGFAGVEIELADGSEIEGLVVAEDARRLSIKTAPELRPISVLVRRIRARRAMEKSAMPEGLIDRLDGATVAGLLDYLTSVQQ